ncbi:MAG: hypothetical protein M1826_002835 [Phylliscum demangeonii]|nr:MAG: hypothetical protein M1826_002835 [Phylliscum demangeonii]
MSRPVTRSQTAASRRSSRDVTPTAMTAAPAISVPIATGHVALPVGRALSVPASPVRTVPGTVNRATSVPASTPASAPRALPASAVWVSPGYATRAVTASAAHALPAAQASARRAGPVTRAASALASRAASVLASVSPAPAMGVSASRVGPVTRAAAASANRASAGPASTAGTNVSATRANSSASGFDGRAPVSGRAMSAPPVSAASDRGAVGGRVVSAGRAVSAPPVSAAADRGAVSGRAVFAGRAVSAPPVSAAADRGAFFGRVVSARRAVSVPADGGNLAAYTGDTPASAGRAARRRGAAMAPTVSPVAEGRTWVGSSAATNWPRISPAVGDGAAVAGGSSHSYGALHRDVPTLTGAPDSARSLEDRLIEEVETGSSPRGGDRARRVAAGARLPAHLGASATTSGRGRATEPAAAAVSNAVASVRTGPVDASLAAGPRSSVAGRLDSAPMARGALAGISHWRLTRAVVKFLPAVAAAVLIAVLLAMSTGHLVLRRGSIDQLPRAGLPAGGRTDHASTPAPASIDADLQAIRQMMEAAGGRAGVAGSLSSPPPGAGRTTVSFFDRTSRELLAAWLPDRVVLRTQDQSSDSFESSLGLDGDHGVDDSFWLALRQKVQTEQQARSGSSRSSGGSREIDGWAVFLADNEVQLDGGPTWAVAKLDFVDMLEARYSNLVSSRDRGAAWVPVQGSAPAPVAGQLGAFAQLAINDIVRRALVSTDWASPALGALVEPRLTSATYRPAKQAARRVGEVPVRQPAGYPPVAALTPWSNPGECWCAHKTAPDSRLDVVPAWALYPKAITVEFPPARSTPDALTAPRRIEVYGSVPDLDQWTAAAAAIRSKRPGITLPERGPRGWLPLARFEYDIRQDNHVQTFPVEFDFERSGAQVVMVSVRILSNWGDEERTCLYRVRVHGNRVA